MQDDKTQLPEGTDRVIAGASEPTVSNSGSVGVSGPGSSSGPSSGIDDGEVLIETDTTDTTGTDNAGGQPSGGGAIADKLRSGRDKLSSQAADTTRGLVGQGLERSAEALANVSRLVGDTADGLDERLGPEYGDYARRAANAIEGAASSIADKDADELIDDTREFVRKSPGIALAGAAIVGFALARLIKTGLAKTDGDGEDRAGNRRGGSGGSRKS